MNQADISLIIAQYEDAIDAIRTYRAQELDPQKIADATTKITDLHNKTIDANWLAITSRTEALNGVIADLKEVADWAANVPQLSNALKDLRGASDKAKELAGGKDVKCKTANCGVKIFYLPNALAGIVAVGGKKKITLICRENHSNEYEISAS
jgi:hypothetical protein